MTPLEKTAFTQAIYGDLPPEFYMTGIDLTRRLTSLHRAAAKFYQAHDLYLAYYRPEAAVLKSFKQSNKAAPAWLSYMNMLTRRHEYLKANQITRGSMELAAAAAARTFAKIAQIQTPAGQTLDKVIRDIDDNNGRPEAGGGLSQEIQKAGGVEKYLQVLMGQISEAVGQAVEQVVEELREYIEAKREAEAAASALSGGHEYALEALSIWRFYENQDEFRRRVRLLSAAALALRQISQLPASLDQTHAESLWGGIDGVTRMRTYMQLPDVLPSELALIKTSQALFAIKLAQMGLTVYRRAAAVKPVVFVDKSGSMDEPLEGRRPDVAKISLAAGLAIAIYRRFGGEVYLFDTEVDRLVNPKGIIKTLLTIRPGSGTAIDPVLEEILRIDRRDQIYIIISDGITQASEDTLRQFTAKGIAKRTRLILVPPGEEGYNWVKAIGRVIKATDIAGFIAAARQALTG
jgi:uncharacterized protein with von Willebrand factor type A (vWA) domain